jgi:pyridoxal phosphate enzyme (YggS family)
MGIKENLESIIKQIEQSASKTGRRAEDIILVGISKNFSLPQINEAIACGLRDIGENRVQEAERKFPCIANARKHFVGHPQSNKVKKAVEIFDVIQSVDALKIAEKISSAALARGGKMPVLVQIRTDEKKHFGIRPEEAEAFLREAAQCEGIRISGLMTIGPEFEKPEASRPVFREMKKLFDAMRDKKIPHVEMRHLSMGMSSDFAIAVEEGANMVRIGRALFGDV